MTPHFLFRRLASLAVSSLFLSPIIHSQQATESKTPQTSTTALYPNNTEGLRQLLHEMLLAAKDEDRAKLQSLVMDAEIPNYENWFTTTFGEEKGESWAGPYGKLLEKNEKEFQDFVVLLARQDGDISVQKLDSAKRYDTLAAPIDEYLANWKKSGTPSSQGVEHIGYFFFIEGKFRWDSTSQFPHFQKTNTASFVPAKLIKRVAPEYPTEAREKGIQGTVTLNVILRRDGSVTVQNVAAGDPILSPAAIEAVRQWRYGPTMLNGQPIEVQTKIDVIFTLSR
jgi:TonB family protein